MHRRAAKRLFDSERPLYARREMTIGDQIYQSGEEIPWKDLDVAESFVMSWFRNRFVGHDQLIDAPPSVEAQPELSADQVENYLGSVTGADGLRTDGPSIEEWVDHGYLPEDYEKSFISGMLQGYTIKKTAALKQFQRTKLGPWDEKLVQQIRADRQALSERIAAAPAPAPQPAPQASSEKTGPTQGE